MRRDKADFNRRTSHTQTTFYCPHHGRVTRDRFAAEPALNDCPHCKSAFAAYIRRWIT